MNYFYPFLTLVLLFFLETTMAAPGSIVQQKHQRVETQTTVNKNEGAATRLPLSHRLVLKMVSKKMQKQQARVAGGKEVKATGRYRNGAISIILLFVGLLSLIIVPILAALGVAGSIYFGIVGLKRDPDPSLAKISLLALGILLGLVAVLSLVSLVRVVG